MVGARLSAAETAPLPTQVWVPDVKEGYIPGWVHSENEDAAEVVTKGGETRMIPFDSLFKMNPPPFDRTEDIANLSFFNEANVAHNLWSRYYAGEIYTYSGLFLVAINPYQSLPLYTDTIIQQYRNKRRADNPPHIFAVAECAWLQMRDEKKNQSILITGGSGAGKTESTKKVIQYLVAIATNTHSPRPRPFTHAQHGTVGSAAFAMPSIDRSINMNRGFHVPSYSLPTTLSQPNAKGPLGLPEQRILQANLILEAFGNAQTQRNNNSSQFGKFIQIYFAPDGSIAGANIDWYLLEKSRIVCRNEAERNFHVFYQLLAGDDMLKNDLLLDGDMENYEYLKMSRREIHGVDDRKEWNALKAALYAMDFTPTEQSNFFTVVAAVLQIGNIAINPFCGGGAMISDTLQAQCVCHLLGISLTEFTRAVLRPRVLAGREWVIQVRTCRQALDELAALSKTLYEKSFGALVDRINDTLDRPSPQSTFIGVLDIAGFGNFGTNGYEQLLINYTNKKLQQFLYHHILIPEQEEYARERIKWDNVNPGLDLQPTIDLIESSGNVIGILSCLDEEGNLPKGTDLTFTIKLHKLWADLDKDKEYRHPGKDKYKPTRFKQGFSIRHYAAKVEYSTGDWLDKNKDPLSDNLSRVLAASSDKYIATLFAEYKDVSSPRRPSSMFFVGKKRTLKKGAFRTAGQRHKEQLSSLLVKLQSSQPHFVCCIVPNNYKKPNQIDVPFVLDQLRGNSVLEGIRIARLGYPDRISSVEFRQRYAILTPGVLPHGCVDNREQCRRMINALKLHESTYKIGNWKIFFKADVLAELEERKEMLLYDVFTRIQSVARMWTARTRTKKILDKAKAIRTIQKNIRVYNELREWPWWQLYKEARSLLAATRSDEKLRRNEAELVLMRENAELVKQAREAMDTFRISLRPEKQKVEKVLEAERVLALDEVSLLERSEQRESCPSRRITARQPRVPQSLSPETLTYSVYDSIPVFLNQLQQGQFNQAQLSSQVESAEQLDLWKHEPLSRTKETLTWLANTLRDKAKRKTLFELRDHSAQSLIDHLNHYLSDPEFREAAEPWLLKHTVIALRKLCEVSMLYPTCYVLSGVEDIASKDGGGFCDIFQGCYQGQLICLKVVRLYQKSKIEELLRAHAREAILWSQLDHPNIVPFDGIFYLERKERICLVSPWMENGNIVDYLERVPDAPRKPFIYDIANGLQYLHAQNIVHGDLKGRNVLIDEHQNARLADFGLSTIITDMTLGFSKTTTSVSGLTTRWAAPELLEDDAHPTHESDIWAFGCVCYEVLTGLTPFAGCSDIKALSKLMKGEVPAQLDNATLDSNAYLNKMLRELVGRCWSTEIGQRPGSLEIVRQLEKDHGPRFGSPSTQNNLSPPRIRFRNSSLSNGDC